MQTNSLRRGARWRAAAAVTCLSVLAGCSGGVGGSADQRAASQGFLANASGACADPWINSAYNQVIGRAPQGSGTTSECHPSLYGGGSWSSYEDLRLKVLNSKVCADPWVGQAVLEANRSVGAVLDIPVPGMHGSGGMCNTKLYGFGQWSSYPDLLTKARATLAALDRAGLLLRPSGGAVIRSTGVTFNPNQVAIISGSTSQVALASKPGIIANDGATARSIVGQSASVVAVGGGNIVAVGGGNIVAVGGGN